MEKNSGKTEWVTFPQVGAIPTPTYHGHLPAPWLTGNHPKVFGVWQSAEMVARIWWVRGRMLVEGTMNILVIGAGALGSHIILFGRNWEHSIRVCDMDRVEMKNTQAQFHTRMGSGRNKVQALQQAMQGMWGRSLEIIPHKLTTDNVREVMRDAELVIDCTDNIEARLVIQGYVREHSTPCLHGGLSAEGLFGRIMWDEYFVPDAEGEPGQATCENGDALPFIGMVGAQMAMVIQLFLETGEKRSLQLTATGVVRLT